MKNYIQTTHYEPHNKVIRKRLFFVLLVAVFAWGFGLRAVEILNHNYLFGHDHGRDYLIAKEMVETGKHRLIGAEAGSGSAALKGLFHGPGYYYILALSYILFRGDPYGAVVIMFLFGILTLIVSYGLVRMIFDETAGLVTLFLVSVSTLIVAQSRFFWGPHPIAIFILFSLYFASRIPHNPGLYAPLSLFFAGFTYHFHIGIAVPLSLSILISLLRYIA